MSDRDKDWRKDPKLLDSVINGAQSDQASRSSENKALLRLYWQRDFIGQDVDWGRPRRERGVYERLQKLTGNLTREVVDAAASIICREMNADCTPMGADFNIQQGCKELSRLIDGVADNTEFLDIATRAFLDGAVCDIGPVKGFVDPETEQIRFERMDPLLTNWVDDGTEDPRTVISESPASRDGLMERYPQYRSEIRDAQAWDPPSVHGVDLPGSKKNTDAVAVGEAWCRTVGSDKGRHVIVLRGTDVVLENEEWDHEITPVISFRWKHDYRGYGGCSLARVVAPYDVANRRLMKMVYASLSGAKPMLVYHEDSGFEGISDVEFEKIPYSGPIPPQVVVPQVVSKEVLERIQQNKVDAFAEGGVNQNMATGNAPARYTSGAAQREFVDIANTRLLLAQKQWEKFWRQFARAVAMLAQQAKKMHVKVEGANYYKTTNYPKLKTDSYKVTFSLASGLGLTHSARLQDLQDLKDAEVITTLEVIRNLKLPDIQHIADRVNAPMDLINMQISRALDEGIFTMPSAMQNLEELVRMASDTYQQAQLRGIHPPAHMECLRRLIKAAQARLAPPPAPPAPEMAPVANDNAGMLPPEALPPGPPVDMGAPLPEAMPPPMPEAPPPLVA